MAINDSYLYEDVPVLKNKLNIRDAQKIAQAEADIAAITCIEVDKINKPGTQMSFDYLKDIHKFIFQDLYYFAGDIRSIPVEKPEQILGGDTVRYACPALIEKEGNKIINDMNGKKWNMLSSELRAEQFSKNTASLWQVHPFREGNTRSVMTFASHFAENNGFPLDKQLFKEHSGYIRNALVKASDGQYSDYSYLKKIMKNSMEIGRDSANIKELEKAGYRPAKKLVESMGKITEYFGKITSVKQIHNMCKNIDSVNPEQKELLKDIAAEFVKAEKVHVQFHDLER